MRVDQIDAAGGGTSATVTAVSPATLPAYAPTAPYGDANGMVASPNVELANELIQQLLAHYTFAANAQVVRADTQFSAAPFDITA
jgi:flagellar basal-body rod protein FlgC